MTLPAVIIGLGRIGVGRGVNSEGVLPNHLSAMEAAGLQVVGLVDPDEEARAFVRARYPSRADAVGASLSDIPRRDNEVIAVSTPVATHMSVALQALARRPCAVILEKPIAADFDGALKFMNEVEPYGSVVLVNFHRRFDTRHRRWRAWAPTAPHLVTARYGKGLSNYASHIIDLLLDWYGPVDQVQALASEWPTGADPNLSFCCHMAAGFDAVLIGVDGVAYDQFEIDIYGESGKMEMRGGGAMIRCCTPVENLYHAGYADLAEGEPDIGVVGGFRELYANIENGVPANGCTLADAVANAAVLDAAIGSAKQGGVAVEPRYKNRKHEQ